MIRQDLFPVDSSTETSIKSALRTLECASRTNSSSSTFEQWSKYHELRGAIENKLAARFGFAYAADCARHASSTLDKEHNGAREVKQNLIDSLVDIAHKVVNDYGTSSKMESSAKQGAIDHSIGLAADDALKASLL